MEKSSERIVYKTITGHKFLSEFEATEYERFMLEFGRPYEIKQVKQTHYIVIVAEHHHDELCLQWLQQGMGPMFIFKEGLPKTAGNLQMRWGFRQVPWEGLDPDKITDIVGFHDTWNNVKACPFHLVHSV